tara:strand:+ start:2126 stop:2341 length:216 start_codon:yes stop_codon:yes gene_type:complete
MSERSVRDIEREMKNARIAEKRHYDNLVTKNRDFTLGTIAPDTKKYKAPVDVPDVNVMPKRKRQNTTQSPF